jgi:RNA polymerase sigma-70 factor (ECF subfamily)
MGHPENADDGEVVRIVLRGQRSAYAVLYDRYRRLIEALCFDATGDVVEAQDLSQEVFLLGLQRLDRLRHPERYPAWLAGIARRVCRDWRRSRGRRRRRMAQMAAGPVPGPGPSAPLGDDREEMKRLHQAILRLPARERVAIECFYLLDQPTARAQAVLRLSRSGLYKVLDRARHRLRHWLQDDGGFPHE